MSEEHTLGSAQRLIESIIKKEVDTMMDKLKNQLSNPEADLKDILSTEIAHEPIPLPEEERQPEWILHQLMGIIVRLRTDCIYEFFARYGSELITSLRTEHGYDILYWTLNQMGYQFHEEEEFELDETYASMITYYGNKLLDQHNQDWDHVLGTTLICSSYEIIPGDCGLTLGPIDSTSFTFPYGDYKNIIRMIRYLAILMILAQNCPTLITDKIMERANLFNVPMITNLLSKYKIEEAPSVPSEKACKRCKLAYPCELVKSSCSCKFFVHINCLTNLSIDNGNTCSDCDQSLGCVQWTQSDLNYGVRFFPQSDVYPHPDMKMMINLREEQINEKLHLAIFFKQVGRIEELLDDMSKEDLVDYLQWSLQLPEYKDKPLRKHYISDNGRTYSVIRNKLIFYKIFSMDDGVIKLLNENQPIEYLLNAMIESHIIHI